MALCSFLGLIFANTLLCHYQIAWLDNCPIDFKPIIYKRYFDESFIYFLSKKHLRPFADYLNTKHKCLKLIFDEEKDNSFFFIATKVPVSSH